jgi:hypothetical protein
MRSKDRWSCLIAGTKGARVLKILERAAIETMIFLEGYVVAYSELWGEKWCGLKSLYAAPQSHDFVRT